MNNFSFYNPVAIHFGKGQTEKLGEILKEYGKKVLLVYGGGSIKKNGLYDVVMKQLEGFEVVELAGVNPNPRIESVREGVELCRKHNIEVILAVGGGSTIDCSKAIAGSVFYDGDAWDIVKDAKKIGKVLPIVDVLTIAATGSEMNNSGVITNFETNEKLGSQNSVKELKEYIEVTRSLKPDGTPSMGQDRINRKPSEVELFAGTVIRLAEKHGIPVPVNRYLYRRVKEIEAEY